MDTVYNYSNDGLSNESWGVSLEVVTYTVEIQMISDIFLSQLKSKSTLQERQLFPSKPNLKARRFIVHKLIKDTSKTEFAVTVLPMPNKYILF